MVARSLAVSGAMTAGVVLVFGLIGFAFGYTLEMAGFGDSRKLAAQFYFRELTVFKVMFTAIAVALARRGHDVHLTTTDPAAHLTDVLPDGLDHLRVTRIDPHQATREYRDRVMATKGKTLDADGRAHLAEDLLSPCTEEIAVFRAFAETVAQGEDRFVVIDTAPTGHTLLLLDAAEIEADEGQDMTGQGPTPSRVIACSSKQLTNLYGTTEIKNIDYNSVKALAEGQINTFLGFRFIRSERLAKSGTTRYAVAWCKPAVALGIGKDIVTSIDTLPTKNYSVQVYARMSIGAVRLEDEGVVEIGCFE